MSTITVDQPVATARTSAHAPIPMTRVVAVEMRKMFDTRSGFWLLNSIGISALLATVAVIVFAPAREQTYATFATAVGFPMAVILPMIAVLSVTGEWSQRGGLTTFTLVPHRGRVILAKAICAVAVGVASMVLAMAVGALGNIVGTAISGAPTVWNSSVTELGLIVLANVLGLLVGFMLGVLLRSSAAAIVSYFVYSFVLPTVFAVLAANERWFRDLQPWVDFKFAQNALYGGTLTGQQWLHLAVSGGIWLAAPLLLGLVLVMRSEVK